MGRSSGYMFKFLRFVLAKTVCLILYCFSTLRRSDAGAEELELELQLAIGKDTLYTGFKAFLPIYKYYLETKWLQDVKVILDILKVFNTECHPFSFPFSKCFCKGYIVFGESEACTRLFMFLLFRINCTCWGESNIERTWERRNGIWDQSGWVDGASSRTLGVPSGIFGLAYQRNQRPDKRQRGQANIGLSHHKEPNTEQSIAALCSDLLVFLLRKCI